MNTKLARDAREWRRRRAWQLDQEGWSQTKIAQALGVGQAIVSKWLKAAAKEGEAAFAGHKHPGPKRELSDEQLAELPALLAKGAEKYGYRGDYWTRERIAMLIARHFDILYSPAHISRIARLIGYSLQKPKLRAQQRNEKEINIFKEQTGQEVKKSRARRKKTLLR